MGCCKVNHGSELPGEHLNRALSGVLLVPIPLYPFIRPLIFTEARGEDPNKCEIKRPAFYFSSFLILSKFDFVFQKGPKPCTFRGSGDHRNTKWNWELIFEISCAYYRSRTNGNGKLIWLGSFLFRHDICFLICQQLAWKRKPVIRLSFLAGRGEAAGNGPYLQGPSHLGLLFQAAMAPMYARKFFL